MTLTSMKKPAGKREAIDLGAAFSRVCGQDGWPEWFQATRRRAWEEFESLPMPLLDEEDWRRTDVRALKLDRFRPLPPEPAAKNERCPLFTNGEALGRLKEPTDTPPWAAGSIVYIDGVSAGEHRSRGLSDSEVIFCDLASACRQHEARVRPYLSKLLGPSPLAKFTALHTAFLQGGTFVYVPRGVRLEQPLLSRVCLKRPGQADFGRMLIVAEEGSEVSVVQQLLSVDPEADGLHCGAVEIVAHPGSSVAFLQLQDWGSRVWSFSSQRASVDRDARVQFVLGELGSRLSKVNQEVSLIGRGADADLLGVLLASETQHLAPTTLQEHRCPDGRSDLLYKAVLTDSARTVWRGNIVVFPKAQKTDAYQVEHNLMLSPDARADSIPGLEIQADDVRCTHGSTIGYVDQEQLFYLRSRGIAEQQARWMIVNGFLEPALDRVRSPHIRGLLSEGIRTKLSLSRESIE